MINMRELEFVERQEGSGTLSVLGALNLAAYASIDAGRLQALRQLEGMEHVRERLREDVRQRIVSKVYGDLIPIVRRMHRLARATPHVTQADGLLEEFARAIGRVK